MAEDKLNPKQERFCELYATDSEFFGNGTQTYIEVYEPDTLKLNWYKTASACAARLLVNAKVLARINKLLEETGFNDQHVDKQLSFLITQHADFGSKLGAIREYNKLKQRIIDKSESKVEVDGLKKYSDEELDAVIQRTIEQNDKGRKGKAGSGVDGKGNKKSK